MTALSVTTATVTATGIGFEYEPTNGLFFATNNINDTRNGLSPNTTKIGFDFSDILDAPIAVITEINESDILNNKTKINENKINVEILNECNIFKYENENETFNYVHYVQVIILKYYHNILGLCLILLIFLLFYIFLTRTTRRMAMDPFFAPVSGISFIDNDIYQ